MSISTNAKPALVQGGVAVTNNHYSVPLTDQLFAAAASLSLLPIWLVNTLTALLFVKNPICKKQYVDAAGRSMSLYAFSAGIARSSLSLLSVAGGRVALVGATLNSQPQKVVASAANMPPGLVSLFDIHRRIGLSNKPHAQLLQEQASRTGMVARIKLVLLGGISYLLYGNNITRSPGTVRIFGIAINNISMRDAINWVCSEHQGQSTRVGYFVNVHSVNIANQDQQFKAELAGADRVFADGSGVRLAAAKAGYRLKDNVNGTDMLPLLCQQLQKTRQSLYLLGAEPGVAEQAAANLQRQFPGLRIAGTQHGYFSASCNEQVIEQINASQADVLLVAFGQPLQERWLANHRQQLQTSCALAVGGLFDFYAGNVSRAPSWMRMIGFEWAWRLLQEPSRMWRRYVLGNPLFLYRTFFLKEELMQ